MENMVWGVSGDISVIISQGGYEASDEDRENQGAAISYKSLMV